MPDASRMLASPDTSTLVAELAIAVLAICLVVWLLPRQLRRTRQLGGRAPALFVVGGAVVLLGLSLPPELFPGQTGLLLTIIGVFIAFQPASIVRLTGGPRVEWQALAEGTSLQRAVARHGDRRAAQHDPDIRAGLARLAAAEAPSTARYIELLRTTLFADPDGPGMADRFAALAVEEANLRRVIGPRPAFEGGLVRVDEAAAGEGLADDLSDVAAAGDAGADDAGADDAPDPGQADNPDRR
jgi:hypothetical protein